MRSLVMIMVALMAVSSVPTAWAQNSDPFSGTPSGGSDPFAQPKPTTKASATPDKGRKAVMARARQALAKGKKPVQLTGSTNDAEARINAALLDDTVVSFFDTPLEEAIQTISQTHEIPIVIDQRALEEIGLSSDAPVSIHLRNVALRSALRLILRDLDLTYMVKDEVMQITTIEAAEQNLILKMYILPNNLAAKADSVVKVLTSTVAPDTWDTLGGASTAMPIDHVLVVSTTSDVQDQTRAFLEMLIEKYGQ